MRKTLTKKWERYLKRNEKGIKRNKLLMIEAQFKIQYINSNNNDDKSNKSSSLTNRLRGIFLIFREDWDFSSTIDYISSSQCFDIMVDEC